MDLNELQSVQSRERQTDSLQQLRATFYQDAAEFIQDLEAERDAAAERADDPWNAPEVGRLNDDIDTAEGTVEAIYERRVGKIVKMASLAAADMPTDDEGLTEEEQALFDQLVAAIEQNREGVFAILDGEDPAIDPADAGLPTETESTPTAGAGPAETPPRDADPAGSPAATDPPSGAANDDHREVPPDPGRPGESEPDPGSSAEETPEPDVGAADLMGSGGERTAGSNEEPADGSDLGDTGPVEADAGTLDSRSTDTAPDPAEPDDVGAGQPVRDGGAAGSQPSDSTTDGVESPGADVSKGGPGGADPTGADPIRGDPTGADRTESEPDGADPDPDVDRAMVRITDDVGPIYGVEGREYDLTTDDVVTLPEANVGPLLKQGAAERMD